MEGLTSAHARSLLGQYGLNAIEERTRHSLIRLFFNQFSNFLVLLLIVGAIISFAIGKNLDGSLIFGLIILNACFGVYQEKKASEAIAALKTLTVTKARVIRDGTQQEIDSKYLVPGDIVLLEEGAKIPADGEVAEAIVFEANEASLTGESFPVAKQQGDTVFMGTIVAKGRATMKVSSTGSATKFGSIASTLLTIEETETPLQKKLTSLSRVVGMTGLAISGIVFFLSLSQGAGSFPAFLLAVSLVVAFAPEGLPAVMTITLAVGVREMAKKKAIVRKLASMEALGSITLIATDKTGTLTTNTMRVKEIWTNGREAYDKLITCGVVCSTASLVYAHNHNQYEVLGDPTEGALLYLAQKERMNYEDERKQWKTIEEKPFDSVTKKMSIVVERGGKRESFTKGSLEAMLKDASSILIHGKQHKLNEEERVRIKETADQWAREGLRIVAFAHSQSLESLVSSRETQDARPATFLGMVGIHDPPRPEVKDAIEKARKAGIKVVMITGDNEKTAEAIGSKIGLLLTGDIVLTGEQIDNHSDEELMRKLASVRIFARTTPAQKARIVKLYQQMGEIVAVTGDGVNDAIALKQADVGVAMGLIGTDVARETADMVITDDNFATIVSAVEEGRNILRNLQNAIKYLLSSNSAEAISLVAGLFLGIPNLFYPVQLLYVNLIGDGVPAVALAFSPREDHVMSRQPDRQFDILKKTDKIYILAIGIIASIIILSAYYLFKNSGELMGKTAAFAVLVMIQSFIFIDLWLSHRPLHTHFKKLISPVFLLAFLVPIVLQYVILTHPPLPEIFKVQGVNFSTFAQFVILSALIRVVVAIMRIVLKKGER